MLLQGLQFAIKGRKGTDECITIACDFITKPEAYQRFEFERYFQMLKAGARVHGLRVQTGVLSAISLL